MASSTTTKTSVATGIGGGNASLNWGPYTTTNTNPPGAMPIFNLAAGDNTIQVPAGTQTISFAMPSGNTNLVKWKVVAGDSGIPLLKNGSASVDVDSSLTSFILNAAGPVNGLEIAFT